MARDETILRFENVSFEYVYDKPILRSVNFSMREGSKFALMGQNGAGKSTIFQLLTNDLQPDDGEVHTTQGLTIATARQVIPRDQLELSIRQFFEVYVPDDPYKLNQRIQEVLDVVHLKAPLDKQVKAFSGGQQARLLLASALIQDPDILLLDEPTNNLDAEGIDHLTSFLIAYHKSCIVISHDADFLNAFTDGVLYLDVFTQSVERYIGNYFDVVEQIAIRLEKENMKNAQLAKKIQANKDKANFFAHKGGKMRLVAKRMREEADELEEEKVDVRKEDKTIRPFTIPVQHDVIGELMRITAYTTMKNHVLQRHTANISLKKNMHLLLSGPNGIGKSTLLETLASGSSDGVSISPDVRVGYYRQDFSTLNFSDTVLVSLAAVMDTRDEELLRSTAAGFLISAQQMDMTIGSLSEGQKGLVAFARLVLQKPGLLILDEPTNHINFRHLPIIAAALNEFRGAMILVSHVPEFVAQIRIDETLDLSR